ncbi:MAG: DNA mismatch repair protein MutS [Gemmobacter sp.]
MTDTAASPMMAQYLEIKARHPDALLFYRMGDFYEMFFDDAVAASAALDIALTSRGVHAGAAIPMCGVPVVRSDDYLMTLIRKGFRVAIAEQLEDPAEARKRGSKAVVARDVVRLVTPGTLTEDTLLEARRNNWLAAFAEVRGDGALAWADISTGEFRVMACEAGRLPLELARLAPREVLVAEGRVLDGVDLATTPVAASSFDSTGAERRLCGLFGVASMAGFGTFSRADLAAMGALVGYLDLTQRGNLPLLRPPVREGADEAMAIDPATRRNLELTAALAGGREGSLLATVDRTLTGPGARLLERRLSAPSRDLAVIHARLEGVAHLVQAARLRDTLRAELRRVPDLDRALSRLALDRGGPRDLVAIGAGLDRAAVIATMDAGMPPLLAQAMAALTGLDEVRGLLARALVAEPPLLVRDGGFVAEGFDAELDDTRLLRDQGRGRIAALQADYAAMTGVPGLRIKHNNVLGYFIETTTAHGDRLRAPPVSATFLHRQTTAGQVRFTTVDLSDLESRILNAGGHAVEIEKRHYAALRAAVVALAAPLAAVSQALAEIDVTAALAELAGGGDWTAPVVDDSRAFVVEGGRHPVVERALRREGRATFVANDCALTPGDTPAIWLLTGPNMAGKSTFLRQNALIALLAQAGSFVPARAARIGLVSQLFSRVGASDDLARGRSTFMVEMVETAAILNQADDRALVILDEIGRGTATYDGLSIAWAVMEHLHGVNRCRALFATHYHEMTALSARLPGVANATVRVKEWEGDVIFLHEVRMGAADRSYGVQVARLAGLPPSVIERAKAVLVALESGERQGGARPLALVDDLPLFRATPTAPPPAPKRPVLEEALRAINPDDLTPKQALETLYALKSKL